MIDRGLKRSKSGIMALVGNHVVDNRIEGDDERYDR